MLLGFLLLALVKCILTVFHFSQPVSMRYCFIIISDSYVFLCADEILFNADVEDIAFLVVGDPFGYVLNYFLLTLHDIHLFL